MTNAHCDIHSRQSIIFAIIAVVVPDQYEWGGQKSYLTAADRQIIFEREKGAKTKISLQSH